MSLNVTNINLNISDWHHCCVLGNCTAKHSYNTCLLIKMTQNKQNMYINNFVEVVNVVKMSLSV